MAAVSPFAEQPPDAKLAQPQAPDQELLADSRTWSDAILERRVVRMSCPSMLYGSAAY